MWTLLKWFSPSLNRLDRNKTVQTVWNRLDIFKLSGQYWNCSDWIKTIQTELKWSGQYKNCPDSFGFIWTVLKPSRGNFYSTQSVRVWLTPSKLGLLHYTRKKFRYTLTGFWLQAVIVEDGISILCQMLLSELFLPDLYFVGFILLLIYDLQLK